MSAEPDIAVLEQGSNSGSDDLPLSVQCKSKGKKKAAVASTVIPWSLQQVSEITLFWCKTRV
jgi:hypothetical protein